MTWWTSESTSMVGSHVLPPSRERGMPPTWTFAYNVASGPNEIERVSGGPPQGVYQPSRPFTRSNDVMAFEPATRTWASAVPTRTPFGVALMHVAGHSGTGAASFQS